MSSLETELIRNDIVGELEAINQYDQHLNQTKDPDVIKSITSIRDEEKVHVGELFGLLTYLNPEEAKSFSSGNKEVADILGEGND